MGAIDQFVVRHEPLRGFVAEAFRKAGSSPREAGLMSDQLVEANLTGHDSHGVGSIPTYLANVGSGDLPLNQALSVVLDSGPLLLCDGNGGVGQVMGFDAMSLGIARAREQGACVLGLRNSHHLGRIGQWAEQCAAAGLVSIHFVNVISAPRVAPFGGKAARLGTNPFTVGIPRHGHRPIIVDFATSKLATGKVRVALNEGKPLPPDVLLTAAGEPTTDPAVLFAKPAGVLLPFGGHKGWGLGLACELLGAALTGGHTQTTPQRRKAVINNMMSIIVSPERLGTQDSYFAEIEEFVAWARSEANRDALLPGDVEAANRTERTRDGIPIDATTWTDIVAAAAAFGATPPEGIATPVAA